MPGQSGYIAAQDDTLTGRVIAPTRDPHAYPHAGKVAAAIAGSMVVEIANGMVPLPDQLPEDFSATVHRFLAARPRWDVHG